MHVLRITQDVSLRVTQGGSFKYNTGWQCSVTMGGSLGIVQSGTFRYFVPNG